MFFFLFLKYLNVPNAPASCSHWLHFYVFFFDICVKSLFLYLTFAPSISVPDLFFFFSRSMHKLSFTIAKKEKWKELHAKKIQDSNTIIKNFYFFFLQIQWNTKNQWTKKKTSKNCKKPLTLSVASIPFVVIFC